MAWKFESLGRTNSQFDDPGTFEVAVWNDSGPREQTERRFIVTLANGLTPTQAVDESRTQIRNMTTLPTDTVWNLIV